jgi:hypothetical protein
MDEVPQPVSPIATPLADPLLSPSPKKPSHVLLYVGLFVVIILCIGVITLIPKEKKIPLPNGETQLEVKVTQPVSSQQATASTAEAPTPTVVLQTQYDNPFDKSTQYSNPFSENENPFDNIQ